MAKVKLPGIQMVRTVGGPDGQSIEEINNEFSAAYADGYRLLSATPYTTFKIQGQPTVYPVVLYVLVLTEWK